MKPAIGAGGLTRRCKKMNFNFNKDIGIDLGTANTLVCIKGKGIVMREPSVVAVDIRNDTVLAVGSQAYDMIGRTPGSIVAVRPLKDGVIADFDITATMLKHFIKKVAKPTFFSRPRIVICMPTGVTEVERRAVENAAVQAAVQKVADELGDDGRILVRESGTEPLIRVMVEAATDELCLEHVDSVIAVLESEGLAVG